MKKAAIFCIFGTLSLTSALFSASALAADSGSAGPVTQIGNFFQAEATAERETNPCGWAATRAFVAAWNACDLAGFSSCDGSRPTLLDRRAGYCHVQSVVIGK